MWDEITYSFSNPNVATVEVLEWITNSIPHFTGRGITCAIVALYRVIINLTETRADYIHQTYNFTGQLYDTVPT